MIKNFNKPPLVSVYIVNHNYGDYLETAIESVLNQTLTSYEIILIDNGSTDSSRKVIENYNGSLQEPHALFMIGYIYANVINDIKSAKIEYEKFIKRFSSHELAPSVKFELEYLGKGIDEIPALKHITS